MAKLFVATLIMPQGYHIQFKVYRLNLELWDFINENIGLSIHIYKAIEGNWYGTLSTRIGNQVQQNNLICQAIFELIDFYKST